MLDQVLHRSSTAIKYLAGKEFILFLFKHLILIYFKYCLNIGNLFSKYKNTQYLYLYIQSILKINFISLHPALTKRQMKCDITVLSTSVLSNVIAAIS